MADELEKFILGDEEDDGLYIADTPKEEPVDKSVEPTDEPKDDPTPTPEEPKDEPTDIPEDKTDYLGWFNKQYETNFESIEQLSEAWKGITPKVDESALNEVKNSLEKRNKEFSLLAEKYKELQDPKSYFADDADFKKSMLIKSNPDINREVAGKVFTADLENGNPLDIIALDIMLKHSKLEGGEAGAKEWFLSKSGIDVSLENGSISAEDIKDLTLSQRNAINLAAEEAARNIASLRDGVQEYESPKEIQDLLSEWEEATKEVPFDMSQWDNKIDDVISKVDKYVIEDEGEVIYEEVIDDKFKAELKDAVIDVIQKGKLEPTKENIEALIAEAKQTYYQYNDKNIWKRAVKAQQLKWEEAKHRELHNDADPDKETRRQTSEQGKTTNMRDFFNLG